MPTELHDTFYALQREALTDIPSRMAVQILIVEDDDDLRSAIGEMFETCLGSTTIRAANFNEVKNKSNQVFSCQIAVIDINLGHNQPSGLDIFNWLKRGLFKGKIVFLTGHAKDHPLVMAAQQTEGVSVFVKPLTFEQILALGK